MPPSSLSAPRCFTFKARDVEEIGQAFELLSAFLGVGVAWVLFALALLASGHNSTVAGTLDRSDRDGGLFKHSFATVGAAP